MIRTVLLVFFCWMVVGCEKEVAAPAGEGVVDASPVAEESSPISMTSCVERSDGGVMCARRNSMVMSYMRCTSSGGERNCVLVAQKDVPWRSSSPFATYAHAGEVSNPGGASERLKNSSDSATKFATSESWALDELSRLPLVEDLRIGGSPDADFTIGSISNGNVDVDPDGNLYLFDSHALHIRVFSPAGQLLRKIASRSDADAFSVGTVIGVRGDTVWARDTASSPPRIILFDRRGEHLFTGVDTAARVHAEERQAPAAPVRFVAIGKFPRHPLPNPSPDFALVKATRDGRVVVERQRPTSVAESFVRVTRTSLVGDTLFSRTLSYLPVRYSVDLLDSIAARSAAVPGNLRTVNSDGTVSVDTFPDLPAAEALIRIRMAFPDFQTPVRDIHIGADGAIWLAREEDERGTTTWNVLDSEGIPRGSIVLPPHVKLLWSSGNTIWTEHSISDHSPTLVRYRIGAAEE